MGLLEKEVDFPRGGATEVFIDPASKEPKKKSATTKVKDEDTLFNVGQKRKDVKGGKGQPAQKKKKKEDATDGIWTMAIKSDMLTEGVMGMGIVRDIHEDKLTLETAYGHRVSLPATQINKKFTELLKTDELSTEAAFTLGQMIPFRVIKRRVDNGKGKTGNSPAIVTCDPSKLNAHIMPARLIPGLTVMATVDSIEEKGAILDLGLQSVTGFLPKEKQSRPVVKGLPVVVRVEALVSRVARVSMFVEQDNLSSEACDKLQLNHLMPGTILDCEPAADDPTDSGVFVVLGNDVRGFIPRIHLPPRLRVDTSLLAKSIRCVVMFCQQNTNLLVLSAHPDLISISKAEKRTTYQGIDIGDHIKCTVMDVVPKKFTVYFTLPAGEDGKTPLITAVAVKDYLHKGEECETFYKIGSTHDCRVMDVKMVERALVVSTRKDYLKQKIVTYKDGTPGELVTAKITQVIKSGVRVTIGDIVKGFIHLNHTTDKKTAIDLFVVGKEIKCRVLYASDEMKSLVLTARPSLVNAKGIRITDYDESLVGKTSIGIVSKILDNGAALVSFYGSVKGILILSETKRLGGSLQVNQAIEVRVISIESEEKRMKLSLADETISSSDKILHPMSVDDEADRFCPAIVTDIVEIGTGLRKTERIQLNIQLKENESTTASLLPSHVSDCLNPPFEVVHGVFKKNVQLEKSTLLGKSSGIHRITSKRFIHQWYENHDVPETFEDLEAQQLVCGIISQRVPDVGVFVEIAGGSGLIGRATLLPDEMNGERSLLVGQTVIARITSLIKGKKHILLSLQPWNCFPTEKPQSLALSLIRSVIEEQIWLASNLPSGAMPIPGSKVSAVVTKILDKVVFVKFNEKYVGCIVDGNHEDGIKVDDKLSCLVIDYSFPSINANLVVIPKTKKASQAKPARVVAVKRDFIAVLKSSKLCYVPSRFHPNIVSSIKESRVAVGDTVVLVDEEIIGNISIGLLEGDINLVQALLHPSKNINKTMPSKGSSSSIKSGYATVKTNEVKEEEDGEESGEKAKKDESKLTNFKVYTGRVNGGWTLGENKQRTHGYLAAQIDLPRGNIGRLHASELPSSYMVDGSFPINEFVKKNKEKRVNVKIIGFTHIDVNGKKVKVAELTMNESKIGNTKLKAKVLSYKLNYKADDILYCFALPDQDSTSNEIKVEISPVYNGFISKDTSEKIDLQPGEMRTVKVKAIEGNKSRKNSRIQLSLCDAEAAKKGFMLGKKVTGRVAEVTMKPYCVKLHLAGGQIALLSPTSISEKYDKIEQLITKFKLKEVYHLYALRRDSHPRTKYFVVTENRYNRYEQSEKEEGVEINNPLLIDREQVKVDMILNGFVVANKEDALYIEIGPGIIGRLGKIKEKKCVSDDLPVNTVINVRVRKVDELGRIEVKYVSLVHKPGPESAAAKRKRESSETEATIKKEKKEVEHVIEDGETIVMEDPGFDWSNTGFNPQELSAVGKIEEEKEEEVISVSQSTERTNKKEGKKEKKLFKDMTKEEVALLKETNVSAKELALIDEEDNPSNDADFARLLRKEPNSANVWIRYMSFFLEKDDITKARETAERALISINYREDEELFNIWTAYLNMEVQFGDATRIKEIFDRAIGNADSLKIHKQLASIYANVGKNEEADDLYDAMIRKFRSKCDDIWILYGDHLMETNREEKARDLMKRALSSVPKQRHSLLINRFAQLEYKKGDAEKGKTLFESLIAAYPKKTDIWNVYIDLVLKKSGIEQARQLFERVCSLSLSIHKIRPFFRKWMESEEKYGDEEAQKLVRAKAEKFLQSEAGGGDDEGVDE